jgi:hypothetical protein
METNTATIEAPTKEVRVKPPVIPTPRSEGVSGRKPIKIRMHVGKEFIRKFEIPSPDARKSPTTVFHLYPLLSDWIGRTLPDGVNPRSHDPECLKSPVARKIEQTIFDKPENFYLANRGSTIIAESLEFDPKNGDVELTINDPENQGLADGATTDAVIAKVQTMLAREALEKKDGSYTELINGIKEGKKVDLSKIPEILRNGRIHLEVFVGLDDRSRIADLVEGRNTSRQVRGWSMADFRGEFDWLKNILEDEKSPFKGKVGYEENSSQDLNILDILSVLTLFHPEYDQQDEMGKEKAPVVAYANKGRMDARLADEELRKGYTRLAGIVPDIMRLWEYIYANFETAYDQAFGAKARLGRREGVTARHDNPLVLPLTGLKSNYTIPNGFIFPLLASFRAIVGYRADKVGWRVEPFGFFDKYGKKLVSELMEQVEGVGGNPNKAGKNKLVYTALHAKAQIALNSELEHKRGGK